MTTARAANGSAARRARSATVLGQLRAAVLATTVVSLLMVVAAFAVSGAPGAAGAAVGGAMVLGFFTFGALVVHAVTSVAPTASLLVALLTYTLQVVLVAVVFMALQAGGALESAVDRTWAGIAVITSTAGWLAMHTISVLRSRQPLYDLPERAPDAQKPSAR